MKFTKTTLDNGLRVITIPIKDAPTVTVLTMVEAGSKYETKDINGLSHFLEHMCFKGTAKRPSAIDISRELDSIGARYNAFTGQEYTGYYAKSHPKHISKVIDVISDMYLNPIFKEEEIEKEKGVIVQEILMYEDMPNMHVGDVFNELLYGDEPAGWNIAGTPSLVRSMTRDHFVNYRKNHYVASSTVVIIAGNFAEEKIIEEIQKSFAGIYAGEKAPKISVKERQESPQVKLVHKKTDQSHLIIGVRSYNIEDKRIPALKVLNAVLGGGMSSRLWQKMRDEMGVCYYVRSSSDEFTDHGHHSVAAGVDTTRLIESIEAILQELRNLKNTEVPQSELEKAKEHLVGNMYLGLESSDAIAEFSGFQEILRRKILKPEDFSKEIMAVTAEEIVDVARDIFQDKNLNLALISNLTKETEIMNALRV